MFRNRSLALFASLAAISLLLVLAAPVQIGGWFSYVIVNGNSMEPVYHKGDLIALLDAPPYRIGDIVTYRHPEIGPVIHRIIGVHQDAFVLKGDNNSWDDSFTPQANDIIGRAWLRIPSAGKHLALLKNRLLLLLFLHWPAACCWFLSSSRRKSSGSRRQTGDGSCS